MNAEKLVEGHFLIDKDGELSAACSLGFLVFTCVYSFVLPHTRDSSGYDRNKLEAY